jgi:hypothetical protein
MATDYTPKRYNPSPPGHGSPDLTVLTDPCPRCAAWLWQDWTGTYCPWCYWCQACEGRGCPFCRD